MTTALVCGISGQDGSLLAKLLLAKGYSVVGTSRDAQVSSFENLRRLGILDAVTLESMVLTDFRSVLQVIRHVRPDEIYNLGGQSSVGLSFQQPVETLESVSTGTLNLLEAIRFSDHPIRLYNAGSSECFGDVGGSAADESFAFRPRSPYAVAKAAATWIVANYREAYGLHACTGILYNHESPYRATRFVTRKITSTAARIAHGEKVRLQLGNIEIWRDWGYAAEYVEAMWLMLQHERAVDYVVATGESHGLREFIAGVFARLDLDWQEHVDIEPTLLRPTDLLHSRGNPGKIRRDLGWAARTRFPQLIDRLVEAELAAHDPAASPRR